MMTAICQCCGFQLSEPIFQSPLEVSLTSHCELRPGRTLVYFCTRCSNLQTPELANLTSFYDGEYNLLTDTEEEDQLYEVRGDRRVFRMEHQIETLLAKAPPPTGAKVLDLGSGKGGATRKLLQYRPDVEAYLFEVSEAYRRFWKNLLPDERCQSYRIPDDWTNKFDLVMSYFVLEHVADLKTLLEVVARILREDGQFYFVVPDVWVNPADFVVADHIQHYSKGSLRALLTRHGFHELSIDAEAHHSAFVVWARKKNDGIAHMELPDASEVAIFADRAGRLADFWRSVGKAVNQFENSLAVDAGSAIYGSGFYGSYLYTCLKRPRQVKCFLDRNPHRQGRHLFDTPIIDPDQLPPEVANVYVGLNPRGASGAIEAIDAWKDRDLRFFYLHEHVPGCRKI